MCKILLNIFLAYHKFNFLITVLLVVTYIFNVHTLTLLKTEASGHFQEVLAWD
jgi:hypothetical protein